MKNLVLTLLLVIVSWLVIVLVGGLKWNRYYKEIYIYIYILYVKNLVLILLLVIVTWLVIVLVGDLKWNRFCF